jgi:raffinose/stachyose/melibiose transport system permease protein
MILVFIMPIPSVPVTQGARQAVPGFPRVVESLRQPAALCAREALRIIRLPGGGRPGDSHLWPLRHRHGPAVIGLILAAALFDFIGKKFGARTASVLRACIYLPQVLPIAVAGIVWGWILDPESGALNTLLKDVGLGSLAQDWLGNPKTALLTIMAVLVWVQVGYPVVIFMAGLQRADPALTEAAEIDGASWWRRLWRITVPQIRPEIYVVLLTCTIAALRVFALVFVLTQGGPGTATQVPSYFSYQNFFQYAQVGYGAAIATVLTIIIVLLSAIFIRVQNRNQGGEA